jgi:aryl-alcohol dehydrogenase-like predicted oxidoreductase
VEHLEENVAAASLEIDGAKLRELGQSFRAA